jgi:hypothetical protein
MGQKKLNQANRASNPKATTFSSNFLFKTGQRTPKSRIYFQLWSFEAANLPLKATGATQARREYPLANLSFWRALHPAQGAR